MADSYNLIKQILRIITPEEISEIATRHNGGKFLSLTDLAYERFEKNISRDFSDSDEETENGENHEEISEAKILPFTIELEPGAELVAPDSTPAPPPKAVHTENENMATFILIEKERLKQSQKSLKQKEIIDLYKKNAHVDVEQIKQTNLDKDKSDDVGILINKKHY